MSRTRKTLNKKNLKYYEPLQGFMASEYRVRKKVRSLKNIRNQVRRFKSVMAMVLWSKQNKKWGKRKCQK